MYGNAVIVLDGDYTMRAAFNYRLILILPTGCAKPGEW